MKMISYRFGKIMLEDWPIEPIVPPVAGIEFADQKQAKIYLHTLLVASAHAGFYPTVDQWEPEGESWDCPFGVTIGWQGKDASVKNKWTDISEDHYNLLKSMKDYDINLRQIAHFPKLVGKKYNGPFQQHLDNEKLIGKENDYDSTIIGHSVPLTGGGEELTTKKPILVERFADNGEHSHWALIGNDGELLWSEAPEEELQSNLKAAGEKLVESVRAMITTTLKFHSLEYGLLLKNVNVALNEFNQLKK